MGQKKEEPPVKKIEKVLSCEFCEEVTEKAAEMKTHLKDKHPEFESMPGYTGYTLKYRKENGKVCFLKLFIIVLKMLTNV